LRPRIEIKNPPRSDGIALGVQPVLVPAGQTVTVDEFPNDSFIDNMDRAVSVNLSGPNIVVQIENKEAYDMTFAAFKFIY